MHIVITHTDFRLYWPARLNDLKNLLSSKGHTLQIIEIAGKGSPYAFADKNSSSHSSDWLCLFPASKMETVSGKEASSALWQQLEKINPDVVLAGAIAFPSGATAVHWCKSRGKQVVIFDNARLQDVPRSWLVNYIKRSVYRNVDAVISPAPSQAAAFEHWGVARERIFFGLNVIDNEWFSLRVEKYRHNLSQVRKELKLPKQFILGVGRLVDKKNWLTMLEAFTRINLTDLNQKWFFVLIGEGPNKDLIETYCIDKQIKNVVIRKFASQETLCKYYACASALILPSKFGETWGLVINEAMASGLPVLSSDQCGCLESLVKDGKNGYVFAPDNSSEMQHALQRFMNLDDAKRNAMGTRSKDIISNWSLNRFSQAALAAIEYTQQNPVPKRSIFDTIINANWKGRYRPT